MQTTPRLVAIAAIATVVALLPALLPARPAWADPALAATTSSAPMSFHSETVKLPYGDRTYPGGAEAVAINANCVACHSAGMVLNQPSLTRAEWTGEVHKMANVYKAPVSAEDQAAIIDYLVATKGRG